MNNNNSSINDELLQLLTEQPTRELQHLPQEPNRGSYNDSAAALIFGIAMALLALHSFFWTFKAIFLGETFATCMHIIIFCLTGLFSLGNLEPLIKRSESWKKWMECKTNQSKELTNHYTTPPVTSKQTLKKPYRKPPAKQ